MNGMKEVIIWTPIVIFIVVFFIICISINNRQRKKYMRLFDEKYDGLIAAIKESKEKSDDRQD